ncbi:uncharacterized protein LOC131958356 isoform X2 [Physella acuta]|uniref:uncharacterized protein LOC131958356 isoform X2 n=1 Tax=Physella acuta TaxID=109671 RepID=UPI0027DC7468|nr:uncharacterized protein LOC131958356 isoform X2 [Physella acuta]
MGNNSSAPTTTSNHGNKLRKSQSVPDTQKLSPDAQVLFNKEKSLSQQKLSGKPGKFGGKKQKHAAEDLPHIPPAEALFLPEFPLRGDLDELEFEVIDVIAKGAFGNVIKVQREDQKRFYAMKVLDKGQIINEGAIRQCKDEAAIQSLVGDHTFIVKAHEYWQSRTSLYIVLDYVPHGDMFTLWTFHGAFPEALVQLYIAEICLVIDYLHNSSVIYRDIKMENILFDPKGHIQVTDFGLAKFLQGGDQTRTVCGTLQYMAPEVLSVYPYGHAADWWSVGILMYAMLAGKYPVDGADTHTKMAQKVFECEYLLPSHISDLAQDVINRFLTKSPHKRLSDIYVIQDLYFFQDIVFSDLLDRKLNPVDVVPEDFFPMTGESWAPQVLTPEEQQHFDQFDDSNETITDEQDHHPYHQPYQKPASYTKQPLIPRGETAPDQQENSQTLPYNQPNSSHYSNQQPQQFGHQQSRESVYNDQQRGSRSFDSEQYSVSDRQSVNSSFDYRQNIALASAGNFTRQNGSMVGSMHQSSGLVRSGSFTQQGSGMGSSGNFTQGSGMGSSGNFTQGSGMGSSGNFTQQGNGMGSSGSFTQQGNGMGSSGSFTQQGNGMGSSGSFTQQNSGLESSSFTQQGSGMGSSSSFTQQGNGMASSGNFTQGSGMGSSSSFTQQGSGMGSSGSFTQQGNGMASSGNFTQGSGMGSSSSFTQQGSGMASSSSFTQQGSGMGSSGSFTQQGSGMGSSSSFTQQGSGMASSGSFTQQNNVDTQRRQSTDHSHATRSSTYMYGETIPERRASTTDRRMK